MKLTLKKLLIQHYAGIQNFEAEFFYGTKITGRNGAGKSTLANAFMELLTDKTVTGAAPSDSIIPKDENGNQIHNLETKRTAVIDIDGTEHTVEKITTEKWRTPRGQIEPVYEGLATTYKIDGFDTQQSKFNDWVESNITDPNTLLFSTNPNVFLNTLRKSTADGRKVLETLAGFSVEKFISENPQFANVARITKGHSIEDTLKQLRRNLTAQKKSLETAQANRDYEQNRQLSAFDKAENDKQMELVKNELVHCDVLLSKYDIEMDDYKKALAEMNSLRKKVNDAYLYLTSKEKSAVTRTLEKKTAAEKKLYRLDSEIKTVQNDCERLASDLKNISTPMNTHCPTCGQELPKERIEEILKQEATHRKNIENVISERMKQLNSLNASRSEAQKELEIAEAEYKNALAESAKEPDDPEYLLMRKKLTDLEETTVQPQMPEGLSTEIEENRKKLIGLESKEIAYHNEVKAKEENVNKLVAEVKKNAQACADIERDIDTVATFSIEKNKALADIIQPYFQFIKWKFLDYTIEGNPVEVCQITVNGIDYFRGLNGSDKKLAEVDMLSGFQKLNGISLPVFIDEASIINEDRLPKDIEQQLIVLQCTDEPLTVKEL